jgi:uncharacterized protein DUF3379
MTCDEARIHIGGDPENASAELLAHLEKCPECRTYRQQMLAFNVQIRKALELDWGNARAAAGAASIRPAADESNVVVLPRPAPTLLPKHRRPRLFAFAASIAATLVVALTLWLSRPTESLATEIVKHVEGEPNSWYKTEPVDTAQIGAVLRKAGVKLGPGMQSIVYASSCWFRGHFVPHLVVTTADGPVTVMILLHEKVTAPQQFNEDGLAGLLVPAPAGAVAVLSRTPRALEQPASEVVKALQSAT